MDAILKQLPDSAHKDFEQFLVNGQKVLSSNRQWCGFTIAAFTTFFVESHHGKLADALVRFILSADCDSPHTLLTLMGHQEFTKSVLLDFFEHHGETLITEFMLLKQSASDELKIAAAGY